MIFTSLLISEDDLLYLIEEVLGIDFDGYISYNGISGGHIHFFEDEETMQGIVSKLRELFTYEEDDKQKQILEVMKDE